MEHGIQWRWKRVRECGETLFAVIEFTFFGLRCGRILQKLFVCSIVIVWGFCGGDFFHLSFHSHQLFAMHFAHSNQNVSIFISFVSYLLDICYLAKKSHAVSVEFVNHYISIYDTHTHTPDYEHQIIRAHFIRWNHLKADSGFLREIRDSYHHQKWFREKSIKHHSVICNEEYNVETFLKVNPAVLHNKFHRPHSYPPKLQLIFIFIHLPSIWRFSGKLCLN